MKNIFTKRSCNIIYFGLATMFVASLIYSLNVLPLAQDISAQTQEQNQSTPLQVANITGDLTKATGGNVYGGEKTGEISINSDGHKINIKGLINARPAEDKVYEAWLQDAEGSDYKLSLGQILENGTFDVSQHMVNPFTYTQFFITEEPQDDVDPNAANAIAGIKLEAPFGR
jgi:hypothetical protein